MEGLYFKANKINTKVSIPDIQPGFVGTPMAKGDKRFWITPVERAAEQIYRAIKKKKKRAYISPRWRVIAFFLKWVPGFIYKRIV